MTETTMAFLRWRQSRYDANEPAVRTKCGADAPLNPAQAYSPDNPFNPVNKYDPGNPTNPINKYHPNNAETSMAFLRWRQSRYDVTEPAVHTKCGVNAPFNAVNRYDPANPLNPVNKYNPTVPFGPLEEK